MYNLREWMETMGRVWLDDPIEGFFGEVPLTTIALKDFNDSITNSFAVVPDANWYMIRSLYLHNVDELGNKFTLAHLKKYNMEWGEYSEDCEWCHIRKPFLLLASSCDIIDGPHCLLISVEL